MMSSFRRCATALSHPPRDQKQGFGHLSVVARTSHCLRAMFGVFAASSLTAGCIVPEAPEYGAARQTPVFVEANSIFPNPFSLQHYQNLSSGLPVELRMQVRSEDAGSQLISVLYVDYKHKDGHYVDHKNYKPLTFDTKRLISWEKSVSDLNLGDGPCHTLTVALLHEEGWDEGTNTQIGTPPDLAAVTWFASFTDDGSATGLLSDCPDASSEITTP